MYSTDFEMPFWNARGIIFFNINSITNQQHDAPQRLWPKVPIPSMFLLHKYYTQIFRLV